MMSDKKTEDEIAIEEMLGATAEDIAETVAAKMAEDGSEVDPRDAEIASLAAERDQLKDQLMRALAEAENTRRRAERDRKDAEAFAGTKLARDLLSVHDNMERALAAADDDMRAAAASLVEGVELTQRELLSAFEKHKIVKVQPQQGDKFDPNLHQAMFEAPVPGAENGTIIEVMQAGFTISGRLLRPALVGVAKAAE
jgi:molecular chaperone GrpE